MADLAGVSDLSVKVQKLPHLQRNFKDKYATRTNGPSILVIGDEEALRTTFLNARQTRRHFVSDRGCKKGAS